MRKLMLTSIMLGVALTMAAQHELRDLDIQVELADNGDATITETRQMTIGDEGTECYIVIGNLNNSRITSLQVSDETGTTYVTEDGDWDVDRSRSEKANRCGIHTTSNGYELCWGVGTSGEHIYQVAYNITNLVKAYTDGDGFNFMFVAEKIKPLPQHVKVTISKPGTEINDSIADIWGFRHYGEINFVNGCIVDETTQPFNDESALIVLARFNKGIFQPAVTVDESFDTVIERAKEGSDYSTQEEEEDDDWLLGLGIVGALIGGAYGLSAYQRKKLRKRLLGDEKLLPWYRDTPVNGDLLQANGIMKALYGGSESTGNLMSAEILRLIYQKAITITMAPYGRNNELRKMLSVKDPATTSWQYRSQDDKLRKDIHQLLYDAAGSDHILQPKELKRYIKENATDLEDLLNLLKTKVPSKNIVPTDAQRVVGMKKFLKEFTLTNERHVEEVGLWKEYLVFATLFGIGDQVRKDMAKMCPEYMEMDNVANAMMNGTEEGILFNNLLITSAAAPTLVSQAIARANGSGGSTSFGGGGGFSGGGSGGGVR